MRALVPVRKLLLLSLLALASVNLATAREIIADAAASSAAATVSAQEHDTSAPAQNRADGGQPPQAGSGSGDGGQSLPQTASSLPEISAVGFATLVFGLIMRNRRAASNRN